MKTAIIIAIIVVADSAGDVLLTKGMRQVGEVSIFAPGELWDVACRALRNHHFLASLLFMAVHFVGFLALLSWADLSFVVPAISAEVVLNVAFADYFLNETVSSTRWIGAVLISIGVILVLWSPPRTFGLPGDRTYAVDEVGR